MKITAYLGFKVCRFVLAFIGPEVWLTWFGISVATYLLLTDGRKSFCYPIYGVWTVSPKAEAPDLKL